MTMRTTMGFFEAQDRARRNTVWLVLAFMGAVAGLAFSIYLIIFYAATKRVVTPAEFQVDKFAVIAAYTLGFVLIASFFRFLTLAAYGGAGIAERLGGKLVIPATADPAEKRLINIVGEMALASGCPLPQLYVMPDTTINAFAAGNKPGNAVIGVTRGALAMPRDQLQGVIAHEFSHIINGDMRINLRLMSVVYGLMAIYYIGYFTSITSRNANARMLGFFLMIAGGISALFGNFIRAAISRQREFLADAAAVQYTRNPDGIGGALKAIGAATGHVDSPKANECAHMFFAEGLASSFGSLLATHPPLPERIRRVLPGWDGKFPKAHQPPPLEPEPGMAGVSNFSSAANAVQDTSSNQTQTNESDQGDQLPDLFNMLFGGKVAADQLAESAGQVNEASLKAGAALMSLPPLLEDALSDSYSARALVYAVLLDECNAEEQQLQLAYLEQHADTGVYDLTKKLMPAAAALPHAARLPLLFRAVPALRMMSPQQYDLFQQNTAALIVVDNKLNLFEWSVQAALIHYLEEHFGAPPPPTNLPSIKDAQSYTLSLLAKAGGQANAEAAFREAGGGLHYDERPFLPYMLSASLYQISRQSGATQKAFMAAAARVAAADQMLTGDQIALLRAFAALLDLPLPLAISESLGG